MLTRYNNIDFVFNLDAEDGLELIIKCFKENNRDKLYQLYVSTYPLMDKDNFISFKDFYDKSVKTINVSENKEEIYKKVNDILTKVCKS